MTISTANLDTGRITLTLSTATIKDLRLLAALRGINQNAVAEELLLLGGLRSAVDEGMNHRNASVEQTKPFDSVGLAEGMADSSHDADCEDSY